MGWKNISSLIKNNYLHDDHFEVFEIGHSVRKWTPPKKVSRGKQMDDATNRQDL